MDSLIAYLNMDGYAAFVWPSYLVAALVMGGLFVAVRMTLRREERDLARLSAATGGRRRRREAGAAASDSLGMEEPNDRGGRTGDGDARNDTTPSDSGGLT